MLRPDPQSSALPRGFRPAASGTGLLVPEEVSRTREVWTKEDGKVLDRALALLEAPERQLKVLLRCGNPDCSSPQIERIKEPGSVYVLQCGCKRRIFTRAF